MARHERFTLATDIHVYFYDHAIRGNAAATRTSGLKRMLQERIAEAAQHLTCD
jgi:hypothetical protein